MAEIRAAVMDRAGDGIELSIRNFPEPDLEPGASLMETTYSEVCGTDVHLLKGQLAEAPYPIIPGHFNVGTFSDSNGEITDVEGQPLRQGDPIVFLDVHETCNSCWYCY